MNIDEMEEFSDLFVYFIKGGYCKKITHLDLSGIRSLTDKELCKVLVELADPQFCPNLLAIHLNDLEANFNDEI